MAQIKMEQDAYIRGIMRKKNDVVEVSSAEARQFTSNGTASDVSDKPEKNMELLVILKECINYIDQVISKNDNNNNNTKRKKILIPCISGK